jgi:hypothetical protein
MLPAGVTQPYYRTDVDTPLGKAKFVFVAANAWSGEQATWLTEQLADRTTYTFVVRHEPPNTYDAPGVTPSQPTIEGGHPTMVLYGHTHEYRRMDANHVISGNGGAPPARGAKFGFLSVVQLEDGTIALTEIDQASGMPLDSWRVTANGNYAH